MKMAFGTVFSKSLVKSFGLIALLVMIANGAMMQQSYGASIPMMRGESLDEVERVYPRDFNGKQTVMVMLFDRDQQDQLDGWAAGMADLPEGIGMVEIALIGKVGGIARYFITGGMASAIEDDEARLGRMMPYFGDADKVKKRMKIDDISEVQAYLLSASGKVLWQASGDYDGQFKTMPTDLQ